MLSKNEKSKMYETVLLPVVLYESETWFLMLREGCILRIFENRALRVIFRPKGCEIIGGWRKFHNKQLHNLYSSPHIFKMIKSRRMGWAVYVTCMGAKGNSVLL
jgi:hypothetical protein